MASAISQALPCAASGILYECGSRIQRKPRQAGPRSHTLASPSPWFSELCPPPCLGQWEGVLLISTEGCFSPSSVLLNFFIHKAVKRCAALQNGAVERQPHARACLLFM